MPSTVIRALCTAALLALLSACGQRGPLTLPDKHKQAATPAASSSAPAGSPAPATAQPDATDPDKKKQDDAKT